MLTGKAFCSVPGSGWRKRWRSIRKMRLHITTLRWFSANLMSLGLERQASSAARKISARRPGRERAVSAHRRQMQLRIMLPRRLHCMIFSVATLMI